jgi:hypothetical protein
MQRDVEAVIAASNYIQHGTNYYGRSFKDCICPKSPCGGVATNEERPDCPEHQLNPNQRLHWASECPGPS